MKQRMDRLNGNSEDAPIIDENGHDVDQIEGRDDPIVALEPDELKQGSNFTGVKHEKSTFQKEASY